jgi:hypothetical protein
MSTLQVTGGGPLARRLAPLVAGAQECLARNIVPGRRPGDPAVFLQAGGGYDTPWTRDSAINTWQAAAWLEPRVARDTLLMVCEPDASAVVWDTQWWDQVIWLVGARELAVVTGDRAWARQSYRIGVATLARLDERCLDAATRLYRGPAVMADGITAYPPGLHDPARAASSFVLDHAATHHLLCLSTNAVYVLALAALADLAELAGADPVPWRRRVAELAARVRESFWLAGRRRFGYLLVDGLPTTEQEGMGVALAILSGVATPDQARATVAGVEHTLCGLPAVWPPFPGLPEDRFGRHGAALWPMIMGVWAQAVASVGDAAMFGAELDRLCRLFEGSGNRFFEVYHPVTGVPDGGWQSGRDWASEPDQTWSATTFIGTVLHGLAGLRPTPAGLDIHPCLPPGCGDIQLRGVRWRGELLDLDLNEGNRFIKGRT